MFKKIIAFIIVFFYRFSVNRIVYLSAAKGESEEKENKDNQKKGDCIIGFFHQTLIIWGIYATATNKNHYTLISNHRDADVITEVTKKLPITCIRINRREPQKGFKEILKASKNHPIGIAVDGPLGPIYKVHPGILSIAKYSKKPIRFLFACSKKITFSSWDKFWLPIPFTKKYIYLSKKFFFDTQKTTKENLTNLEKMIAEEKILFDFRVKEIKSQKEF